MTKMRIQSRESLAEVKRLLDSKIAKSSDQANLSAAIGTDFFVLYKTFLESSRLTNTVLDVNFPIEVKYSIFTELFADNISKDSMLILQDIAGRSWSAAKDILYTLRYIAQLAYYQNAAANGEENLQEFVKEIFSVSPTLLSNDLIGYYFKSNFFPDQLKDQVVAELLAGKVTKNVLPVLVGTAAYTLNSFVEDIEDLLDTVSAQFDKEVVKVYSASELTNSQQNQLIAELKPKYGDLLPIYFVDSKLIGGVVVRFKNQIIDGSVLRKLKSMYSVLR